MASLTKTLFPPLCWRRGACIFLYIIIITITHTTTCIILNLIQYHIKAYICYYYYFFSSLRPSLRSLFAGSTAVTGKSRFRPSRPRTMAAKARIRHGASRRRRVFARTDVRCGARGRFVARLGERKRTRTSYYNNTHIYAR